MDHRDNSLAWLTALFGRVAALVQCLLILLMIAAVFYGLWFSFGKQRSAGSRAERMYWRLRCGGFALGAYAIVLFFWAVLHAGSGGVGEARHLYDYWPAFCMFWNDDSWFGAAGHANAVDYESVFMGTVACVVAASARWFGSYDWDCDDFMPTH